MLALATSTPTAYWYLARGTGIVALLALTASVVLGILNSERYAAPRWPRFAVDRVHRDISLLVLALLVVHIVTSVLDGFAPITYLDGVIPFISGYRPLWLGLGTLAFDILIAVAVTSLLRRRIGFAAWRAIHWTAYACWPVAVFHGLGTGTDANVGWALAITAFCVAAVVAALIVHIIRATAKPGAGRGLWLGLTAAMPVVMAAFAVVGPLAPHWARRAGTPESVLLKAHPVAALTPPAPTRAPAPATTAHDSIPERFSAHLSGTLSQTQAAGGALVDLVLRCSGPISGEMRIRLAGVPIGNGGLSMTGSQVQLTAVGLTSVLEGQVSFLQGTELRAQVHDSAGTTLRLHAQLNIDNSNNTVTGTLDATP